VYRKRYNWQLSENMLEERRKTSWQSKLEARYILSNTNFPNTPALQEVFQITYPHNSSTHTPFPSAAKFSFPSLFGDSLTLKI
jgi:hypothetical protein